MTRGIVAVGEFVETLNFPFKSQNSSLQEARQEGRPLAMVPSHPCLFSEGSFSIFLRPLWLADDIDDILKHFSSEFLHKKLDTVTESSFWVQFKPNAFLFCYYFLLLFRIFLIFQVRFPWTDFGRNLMKVHAPRVGNKNKQQKNKTMTGLLECFARSEYQVVLAQKCLN